MIEFFSNNNTIITLIFSGVVSVATIVYAILTWQLVAETRQMRKAQTEPMVSVIVQPKEDWISFLDIIVQNIGLGPAYDIQFELNKDFKCFEGNYLGNIGVFRKGISYMAPAQKFQFFFTNMNENYDEKINSLLEIKVSYKNAIGSAHLETYVIDLSCFKGLTQLGEPPLCTIAKSVESMQKNIDHIANGWSRIKTQIYTVKDVQREAQVEKEKRDALLQKQNEPADV